MSESDNGATGDDLQFDRVVGVAGSPGGATAALNVVCASCRTALSTEYYDINGSPYCGGCREAIAQAGETPRGARPFAVASVLGLGAGVVGAAIYYAVLAVMHLEIGLVAILIGYMVGYAVRRGAGGRGGRRFQVLAVALTYTSIALAYAPPLARAVLAALTRGTLSPAALPKFLFIVATLPVQVVLDSFPSGLISAFIMFIGMQQAWKMTGPLRLQIRGPYRVGVAQTERPA